MGTRTVTGTVYHADGTAWEDGVVKFILLEPFETATEVYPKETHSETCDSTGALSITLGVPDTGSAPYLIRTPDNIDYRVNLAAGAATTLVSLLSIAASSIAQDAVQTLIDANNKVNHVNVTDTHIIDGTKDYIRASGTFTVTLPEATGSDAPYLVTNIGSGTITLAAYAGDTVGGSATLSLAAKVGYLVIDAVDGAWDAYEVGLT